MCLSDWSRTVFDLISGLTLPPQTQLYRLLTASSMRKGRLSSLAKGSTRRSLDVLRRGMPSFGLRNANQKCTVHTGGLHVDHRNE